MEKRNFTLRRRREKSTDNLPDRVRNKCIHTCPIILKTHTTNTPNEKHLNYEAIKPFKQISHMLKKKNRRKTRQYIKKISTNILINIKLYTSLEAYIYCANLDKIKSVNVFKMYWGTAEKSDWTFKWPFTPVCMRLVHWTDGCLDLD